MHSWKKFFFTIFFGVYTAALACAETPLCSPAITPKELLAHQGMLEAVIFDHDGAMLLSNLSKNAVQRLPRIDATVETYLADVPSPGGMALGEDHDLFVGYGDNLKGLFPSLAQAGILRVDQATGLRQTYARGLAMSNGVRRGKDGTLYVSDDMARVLGRVLPNGKVEEIWLKQNSNGMVFSRDGQTLYINQTFPAKVLALDLRSAQISLYAQSPTWLDQAAMFDGLTIDAQGNLYVAAYAQGKIIKVDRERRLCVLATGLRLPSDLAFGAGKLGFAANDLFVTTHDGHLYQLRGVIPATDPAP